MSSSSITETFFWAPQGIQNCADSNELCCFLCIVILLDKSLSLGTFLQVFQANSLAHNMWLLKAVLRWSAGFPRQGIPETELGLQNS